MSMSNNVNVNKPGDYKFPPKKVYNISTDPDETETRTTESSSVSDNNLSKESTSAVPVSSNNNIKCETSGENSRDENIADKETVSETVEAHQTDQSTLKLESNQKFAEAGSPKLVNIDVDVSDAGTVAPSLPADRESEKSLSTEEPKLEVEQTESESRKSETGESKDTPPKGENSEHTDEPIEVDDPKDDAEIGNKAENDETQENALESAEQNARNFVDYSDKDFDTTDTDFNKSGSDGSADSDKESQNKKGAGKTMGGVFGAAKKQKCQGTSSEDEDERPWRQVGHGKKGKRNVASQPKKEYNLRPSQVQRTGLGHLKRQWSDNDTQMYRSGYPGKRDNPREKLNVLFYKARIPSKPDGVGIDEFHDTWWNDYERLERHHGFIQWLFPIRESGMNWHAQELQLHEAEAIRNDPAAFERFKKSYEMMLNFYGIVLADRRTGAVKRAGNFKQRFQHLNHSMHNYLRITRILKCLGEMGLEHYKVPFLKFMLREAVVTGLLDRTLESCYNYWIGTVKDDSMREKLRTLAERWSRGEKVELESEEEEEEEEEEESEEEMAREEKKSRGSRDRIAKGKDKEEDKEEGRQRKRSGEDKRRGSKEGRALGRKEEGRGGDKKNGNSKAETKKPKGVAMEYDSYSSK